MSDEKPPCKVTISDPSVRKLLPAYLARRQAELVQLDSALAGGQFDAIGAIAHGLKGSGGLYGLQPISDFGALLEDAAKARDAATCESLLGGLKDYLRRLDIQG